MSDLDASSSFKIYLGLLALTAATLAASLLKAGRTATIAAALLIASVKGGLILWHYMHLKGESRLIRWIAGIGALTFLILLIGLAPDFAWRRT